jgi:cell division transport system permease protein
VRGTRRHWHQLRYFVADAWDECKHSPAVNLLALSTLTAALFLAGLVLLVLTSVQARVDWLRADVPIVVYLEDDLAADELEALRADLESLDGVSRVDYVDKAEALRRYREFVSDAADLVGELESNPLPRSLEVLPGAVDGTVLAEQVTVRLRDNAGVEQVSYDRDWVVELGQLMSVLRWGSLGLSLLVLLAVAFVIAAVLRLAVYARREEIEIMLLVGATPGFIRGPFLVAGLLHGLLASIVAVALVELARRSALLYDGPGSAVLIDLFASRPLGSGPTLLLLAAGIVLGLLGARLAVRA